jgi:hypothetical protein
MNAFFRFLFGNMGEEQPSRPADSAGKEVFSPDTKLTFEETVSHMARGYDNTQRVIQFMDAKAGAVVALSLAIFVFVGKVCAWAFEKTDAGVLHALPCGLVCVLVFFGIALLVCGFVSLTYAFLTVRPNHLPNSDAFSTLFPAHSDEGEEEAKRRLQPIVAGADCGFAVDEYRRQLIAVGKLVHRKINWLRTSIHWLWCQGLASVILGAVISWMGISGKLVKEEPKLDAFGKPRSSADQVVSPRN